MSGETRAEVDDEATTPETPPPVSRRRFLGVAGAAVLAVAAGACTGDDDAGEATGGAGEQATTTQVRTADNDAAVAHLGAGVERLAVDIYAAILTAAAAGRLGVVPPAVEELVTAAKEHHEVHLSSWNAVLRRAGRPDVTAPNAALKAFFDETFADVTDAGDATRLALTIENIASQTYNKAIPRLRDQGAVRLAAQIQVVDQQHIATLRYVLGAYPVGTGDLNRRTVAFQPTDLAASG